MCCADVPIDCCATCNKPLSGLCLVTSSRQGPAARHARISVACNCQAACCPAPAPLHAPQDPAGCLAERSGRAPVHKASAAHMAAWRRCWDCAAGALMVTEAGGQVLDPSGAPFDIMSRRVLATNAHLGQGLAAVLRTCPEGPREPGPPKQ